MVLPPWLPVCWDYRCNPPTSSLSIPMWSGLFSFFFLGMFMMLFPGSLELLSEAVSRQKLLGDSRGKNIIRNYSRNPECLLEAEKHNTCLVCSAHAIGLFKGPIPSVLQDQTPDASSKDAVERGLVAPAWCPCYPLCK